MGWLRSAWVAVAVAAAGGCGGDDDGGETDAGGDASLDAGTDAGMADGGWDAGPPPPSLCAICRTDSDCAEGALCLVLGDGERGCGVPCEGDGDCDGLGWDAACEEEVPGLPTQCRPTAGTCVVTDPGAPCTDDTDCSGRYDRCVDAEGLGAVCTTACGVDADCPAGMRRCRDTGEGRFCIPDEKPAAERCAAMAEVLGIGRCEDDGSCPGGGTCVGSGDLRLCLQPPDGPLEYPCGDHGVAVEVDGTTLCAPTATGYHPLRGLAYDCRCLLEQSGALLDDALALVDQTRCDLHFESELTDLFVPEVSHDPYRLSFTDRVWGDWALAVPFAERVRDGLDTAATAEQPLSNVLNAAGTWLDLPDSGGLTLLTDLTESIAQLVEATGGRPDRDAIAAEVGNLDADLAERLATVVGELLRGWRAREDMLARFDESTRQALFDGASALFVQGLGGFELRRSDLRGALLGDIDMSTLKGTAASIGHAIDRADLRSFAGAAGDLTVDTPIGRIAVRGGDTDHTYEDEEWHETLLLVDLGGDDTYRFPAGATTGIEHGVAVVVDVGGTDDYGYDEVPHARDEGPPGHARLPSDADGRNDPAAGATDGPWSRSRTSRQGAGRLGIGMLIDLGPEGDRYRSLRMSQGYGALGVGLLYDAGGDDVYEGEAAVQGAAGFGIGMLVDRGGNDRYVAYHVSQGFAYARAVGVLWDGAGDDEYFMHPSDVLYWSPQDPGGSNSSLGQGMGFGRRGDFDGVYMSGGLGVLRDVSGADSYTAGIFAQASGYWYGTGMLIDSAGNDRYDAQWYVQSGAAHFATSVFLEEDGNDVYNAAARRQNVTLGGGHDLSVSWFVDRAGNDEYHAPNLSIGAGNVAGAGFFADAAGDDSYECSSDFSFGNASVDADDTLRQAIGTLGIFLDADGTDTHSRPSTPPPENDASWTQSRHTDRPGERGAGIDRTTAPLGI